MFGSRIPLKQLALVCRSLSTMLHSGVAIHKAFDLAGGKSNDARCREAMRQVSDALRRGRDVSTAMRDQGEAFPDLMIDMISVAEQSGALPEILEGLADHYDNNLQMRKNFIGQIAWPVFQFVAAVFVIALLILVLGIIAEVNQNKGLDSKPLDIIPFGLAGVSGALIWLFGVFGTLFSLFVAYQIADRMFAGRRFLDPLLLQVPVLGHCMRSFAIARFSWAFYLTQQTGMPIQNSLDASLRATANGAFIAAGPAMCRRIEAGEDLGAALAASHLFPDDFLQMVHVGETSGTVPEMLHRLSPQFEDQARRSLRALTAALGWGVWIVVALFIIFFIFRFVFWYIGMLEDAMNF